MNVEVLKRFDHHSGNERVLFSRFGGYYVASNNGSEIVIFKSNSKGEIVNYAGIYDSWTYDVINFLF
tara:strand:- start:1092 stop:1292 length:201 start_codon:yes stop_codon:yes gene_type:complete